VSSPVGAKGEYGILFGCCARENPLLHWAPRPSAACGPRRFAVNPIRASYANHTTSAHHAYENTAIADSWRDQRVIGRRPDERRRVDDTEEDAGRRRCLRAG